MKSIFIFSTLTVLNALVIPALAVEPANDPVSAVTPEPCHTIFTGALNDNVLINENWNNGIPRRNQVACFPPEAADLADTWPGIVRILEPVSAAATDSAQVFQPLSNPPNPTDIGGCCLGSSCVDSDYFDCMILGGFFRPGVFCSGFNPCVTGVCCVSDPACLDDEDLGGPPMDEEICNLEFGNYIGGATCDASDPCQRFRIPEGFEIVDLWASDVFERGRPRLNNCGESAFHIKMGSSFASADIFVYDNGTLRRIITNDDRDVLPEINDLGDMVWARGIGEAFVTQTILFESGEEGVFFDTQDVNSATLGMISNPGHIVWVVFEPQSCVAKSDIHFYDGITRRLLFADGLSNQSARANDHDDIIWTHYDFPCGGGFGDWTSDILFYSQGVITPLLPASETPDQGPTPQGPKLNNLGEAVISGSLGVEYWDGINDPILLIESAFIPDINDRGDLVYTDNHPQFPVAQVWIVTEGITYQISEDPIFKNTQADLNEQGELSWSWFSGGNLIPAGIRYMRRIRNGDVTFDGVVDINDFIPLPGCWTGSVETDGLCECRFFDIDHDRDIDDDDFALFMRVYSGPQEDCNGNGILDLTDLIAGTSSDCNLNGIPDTCEITATTDVDGDGRLDACCVAPTVSTDVLGTRNRMLAVTFAPMTPLPSREGLGEGVDLRLSSTYETSTPPESPPERGGGFFPTSAGTPVHRQDAGATQEAPSPAPATQANPGPATTSTTALVHRQDAGATQAGFTYIRHGVSTSYALRVTLNTLPAGFEAYEGTTMWATAPFKICQNSGDGLGTPPEQCGPAPGVSDKTLWIARLVCDPAEAHYTDWSTVGTVHLLHETIVPGGSYTVQTILDGCGIGFAGNFSAAGAVTTSKWGDVVTDLQQCPISAANGNVDLVGDVVSIIKKFSNATCAVGKSRADLEPGNLDFKINITDAVHALNAFTGQSYPFAPTAPPCP